MNYIIDQQTKRVLWINSDPNQLGGEAAWSEFDANRHQIAYALHYNPQVGETFKATLENGIAKEFLMKKVYNKNTMLERALMNWNEELDPATETEEEPLKDQNGIFLSNQRYSESGWIVDLSQLKEELLRSVDRICETKIVSGFASSALGDSHRYGSDRDDQLNLIGSVSIADSVLYKCEDMNGVKEYKMHSNSQIKQVLNDGAARKIQLLQRAAELKSSIRTANSFESISKIDINSGWD
ncbi:hypothetical protein [Leptospira yasudae]|uniref:DUF4376 domain-containing protein n=1 Tax=Leptospira yasudae TaxID=2202201 RepID=A0A6N4QG60_9LEPT|nr:hypothetical protein [Leptospira yasudae]TGL77345.1 hypothetical protein EHQ77_15975 [Leptospira yasudae]TGL78090.1 hypothetical protein EHQ72_10595 [Leptospira yasudae]TGL87093.1 hypothetical protein EHQ83_04840 [Leptospira yasudae]